MIEIIFGNVRFKLKIEYTIPEPLRATDLSDNMSHLSLAGTKSHTLKDSYDARKLVVPANFFVKLPPKFFSAVIDSERNRDLRIKWEQTIDQRLVEDVKRVDGTSTTRTRALETRKDELIKQTLLQELVTRIDKDEKQSIVRQESASKNASVKSLRAAAALKKDMIFVGIAQKPDGEDVIFFASDLKAAEDLVSRCNDPYPTLKSLEEYRSWNWYQLNKDDFAETISYIVQELYTMDPTFTDISFYDTSEKQLLFDHEHLLEHLPSLPADVITLIHNYYSAEESVLGIDAKTVMIESPDPKVFAKLEEQDPQEFARLKERRAQAFARLIEADAQVFAELEDLFTVKTIEKPYNPPVKEVEEIVIPEELPDVPVSAAGLRAANDKYAAEISALLGAVFMKNYISFKTKLINAGQLKSGATEILNGILVKLESPGYAAKKEKFESHFKVLLEQLIKEDPIVMKNQSVFRLIMKLKIDFAPYLIAANKASEALTKPKVP